uniref:PepSY domain-containing protein n=1 Tax=Desulfobacca acetoxidans TaxID=60893 RepID=A0A7C3UXQ9_9BACT
MNEALLRKWHRTLGIILALLLFCQAGSGALLALKLNFKDPGLFGLLSALHFGGGFWGNLYRILLGLGTMALAVSGTLIYLKIRARTRK